MTSSKLLLPTSKAWTSVPPRFVTEWPDGPGVGAKIGYVQTTLGSTPLPWQVLVHHAVGARRPDGRPRYPLIVISVQRQAGKTKSSWAQLYHTALTLPDSKSWYTCDTGVKARTRWLEMVRDSDRSPWTSLTKTRKTNGSEELLIPSQRSQIRPHPPTADSLHSEQSDKNVVDEGWSYDEEQAAALMQAISPTQTTRPHRQTIVLSTMGDASSTWFHNLVDRGYAGDPGIFLIDFGISDNVDPTDLHAVAAAHPAFGLLPGVDMELLETMLSQLGPAGFARAYGNRRTATRDALIDPQAYKRAQTDDVMPNDVEAVIGAAIDMDRTETAIAAASWVNGMPLIEILEVRPGTTWATSRLRHYKEVGSVNTIVVDRVGPSSTLFADAERDKLKPMEIKARELCTATVELWDRLTHRDENSVLTPQIRFRPDPALDLAMEVADKRGIGDSWTWDRRGSAGSIAALEAATLALHGLINKPAPAQKPRFF